MKKLIGGLAVLVVLLALAVLYLRQEAPPPEMMKADTASMNARAAQTEAEVRQELTRLMDTWKDACLRGDAGAFMSLYTSDARVYYPGMNFDRDELGPAMEEYLQAATWTEADGEFLEVFVHGDVAYAISELSETIQMEGQEPEPHISNCFSRLVKEDGAWKLDRDMCAPKEAPAEG